MSTALIQSCGSLLSPKKSHVGRVWKIKVNQSSLGLKLCQPVPGHPELTSNKMAQIWNNLQLNNAKSIADVRASALEWYRTNLQD